MVRAGVAAALGAAALAAPTTASRTPAVHVLRFVDHTRVARYRTGAVVPRTLVTYVRYPTTGRPPYPLVVFAHGFAVAPGFYATLLDAWARAGYVVAAPLFPLERPNAPGGPDESDLVNQPADIRFVLTRLLARLHGTVDPHRIAVAGQSDGGETAFATAYERSYADRRVTACIVLSGARLPGEPLLNGRRLPPLLAVQGTADRTNAPVNTDVLFRAVERPKFLLWLLGAGHLPPYSSNVRERTVVERVTVAFLDRYLRRGSPAAIARAAAAPGIARLVAEP